RTGSIGGKGNGYASRGVASRVVPAPEPPGVHFIQRNYATPATSTASITLPFRVKQTSSDLNIAIVSWRNVTPAVTISSVTDTAGNTYSIAAGPTASSNRKLALHYAQNIPRNANNIVTV